MASDYCQLAFDHEPGEVCEHCLLQVDRHGNTEADFRNCSFPDCGCDGARLCMAGQANTDAQECNLEGMYGRKDRDAVKARLRLLQLTREQESL